jgi:hypothetical protein
MKWLNVFWTPTNRCAPLMPSEPRIQGKKLADILKASRLLGSAMPNS